MIERWIRYYKELLTGAGASEELAVFIENATVILVTIGLAILADFVIKRINVQVIKIRKYLENYLQNHPKIHQEMTFLVRHLQPAETGIPMEIYVFSREQEWAKYEALQADIFDHLLAILPEFGLRVFQNPTGDDFQKLAKFGTNSGD